MAPWRKQTLPALKKKALEADYLFLYADEASISVVSALSHTYAPSGKTPVITTSTEINLRRYRASATTPAGERRYRVRSQSTSV